MSNQHSDTTLPPRIVTLLPPREGFSPESCGAIALCVKDFTLHSRWREEILVVGGRPEPHSFEGVRYDGFPRLLGGRYTRQYGLLAARLLLRLRPALAEIHNRPRLILALARRLPGQAMALHLHNDPQEMAFARTPGERRALLAHCRAVYCVSEHIRARFLEGAGEKEAAAKLHVIHNGLEIPAPPPAKKEKLILFAGRFAESKGALLFAEALALALPGLPGWRGAAVGSDRHAAGGRATPYERRVRETLGGPGGRIEQTGYLSHARTMDYFARAEIAVIPSLWAEPFGRTALEAMASGCAVLHTGTGGLAEVVGDAGLLIAPPTPERLAALIAQLAEDAEMRRDLQQRAYGRSRLFAIDLCTKRLDEAREAVIAA